jgi:demethylmenaquinone methyltransferase / 2-methoxy-6-polyprenyl-1,4-benzoquinol methylase
VSNYLHNDVVPYQESNLTKKAQVEKMFDTIAPKYDMLNRVLSLGIDISWRKKVIKLLQDVPKTHFLDIATGTADLAMMLAELKPQKITGIDISQQMLNAGDVKIAQANLQNIITLQKADAEQIPFSNDTFAAATVAFGVRNFANLDAGLSEIKRVLQPNGKLIILEFSKVKIFPIKQLFEFYFRYITPLISKLLGSNMQAYQYLPQSVAAFPQGKEMCSILQGIGYSKVSCINLSLGIASIYIAHK